VVYRLHDDARWTFRRQTGSEQGKRFAFFVHIHKRSFAAAEGFGRAVVVKDGFGEDGFARDEVIMDAVLG
jgi:hypothetical protein